MTSWSELVDAALVGTDRRPFAGVSGDGPLGEALRVFADPPDLLGAATATWAFGEAGWAPPTEPTEVPVPADEDPRPLLSAGARRALASIVGDRRLKGILPEWLHLAAGAGGRLRPEEVPALLDAGGDRPAETRTVAGPVGTWLAGHNEAWAWVRRERPRQVPDAGDTEALVERWATVGDDQRPGFLAAIRRQDPAAGRRLFSAIWADEPTGTRPRVVTALSPGLEAADEPVLEDLLADRRQDVRKAAIGLLDRLPTSRRAERMAARVRPLVRITGRVRPTLTVDLPGPPDAAALRDGVDRRASPGLHLEQLAAGAPLGLWPELLGRSPADLVDLATKARAQHLLAAWSQAAATRRDREWASALFAAKVPMAALLISALPDPAAAVATTLKANAAALREALRGLPGPWDRTVSTAALTAIGRALPRGEAAQIIREALPALALVLDPALADAASRLGETLDRLPETQRAAAQASWRTPLATFAATVQFRRALHEEFR